VRRFFRDPACALSTDKRPSTRRKNESLRLDCRQPGPRFQGLHRPTHDRFTEDKLKHSEQLILIAPRISVSVDGKDALRFLDRRDEDVSVRRCGTLFRVHCINPTSFGSAFLVEGASLLISYGTVPIIAGCCARRGAGIIAIELK
jgi:hypothetical protein